MKDEEIRWPEIPRFPEDAFRGTSRYYADHRPPYPMALLSDLLEKGRGRNDSRLLDLGCGPGRVTLPLAPYFKEIWAVDPEREMLEEGMVRTPEPYRSKIHWIHSTAEAVDLERKRFQLITIGEAFHRMDQRLVAQNSRDWLVPGGRIAIIGYKHFWNYSEGWKQRVNVVLDRYGGHQVRKNRIGPLSPMSFEEVLEAVGFIDVNQREYEESRSWSEDEIMGYLFSVSTFSKRKLGDRAGSFEEEVRGALRIVGEGKYEEKALFQCLVAKAPL